MINKPYLIKTDMFYEIYPGGGCSPEHLKKISGEGLEIFHVPVKKDYVFMLIQFKNLHPQ